MWEIVPLNSVTDDAKCSMSEKNSNRLSLSIESLTVIWYAAE